MDSCGFEIQAPTDRFIWDGTWIEIIDDDAEKSRINHGEKNEILLVIVLDDVS